MYAYEPTAESPPRTDSFIKRSNQTGGGGHQFAKKKKKSVKPTKQVTLKFPVIILKQCGKVVSVRPVERSDGAPEKEAFCSTKLKAERKKKLTSRKTALTSRHASSMLFWNSTICFVACKKKTEREREEERKRGRKEERKREIHKKGRRQTIGYCVKKQLGRLCGSTGKPIVEESWCWRETLGAQGQKKNTESATKRDLA